MRKSGLVCGVVLGAMTLPAFACDLPALPVIPAAADLGDRASEVTAAAAAYFDGMRAYAACIEAALAAAGGNAAPPSVSAVLIARNNAAVAEAQAIQKLFQERVATGQTATPGSDAALRKLVEGIASGTPDYAAMTVQMQRVTRQQLGNLRRDLSALGALRSIGFRGVGPRGEDFYEVHYENGTLSAAIRLDDDGKIDFALLRPPL